MYKFIVRTVRIILRIGVTVAEHGLSSFTFTFSFQEMYVHYEFGLFKLS